MSFENNEERIERLEAVAEGQTKIVGSLLDAVGKFAESSQREKKELLSLMLTLKQQINCTSKIIIEHALFTKPEIQSALLNQLNLDDLSLEKSVADLKERIALSLPLLPPLPPTGSGPWPA